MKAIFEITAGRLGAVPADILTKQVSNALEQRTEYLSRQELPGVWKVTDQLRGVPCIPEAVLKKRRRRRTVLSVLCLALGIFVLVPGLAEPRDLSMIVVGAAAVCLSCFNLWSVRNCQKNQFEKPAEQLLEATLFSFPEGASLRVSFSESEMLLEDVAKGVLQKLQEISYSEFECAVETDDLYFLAYRGNGSILPKNCMIAGTEQDFRSYLATKTTLLQP